MGKRGERDRKGRRKGEKEWVLHFYLVLDGCYGILL